MNIVLSSTVLASVLSPAFSFSYLESLGGASPVDNTDYNPYDNWTEEQAAPAPAAPAPFAAAPVAAAPAASYQSGFADVGDIATTSAGYLESVHTGESIHGPGLLTHVDTLNTGQSLMGGGGIHTYAENLPVANAYAGGAGLHTYCDDLSPSFDSGASYSPFGSSASPSTFSGQTSADGVTFTLDTGDISGLVQDLNAGGSLRLTGSIDSISYN
jgi:hypothetical protein